MNDIAALMKTLQDADKHKDGIRQIRDLCNALLGEGPMPTGRPSSPTCPAEAGAATPPEPPKPAAKDTSGISGEALPFVFDLADPRFAPCIPFVTKWANEGAHYMKSHIADFLEDLGDKEMASSIRQVQYSDGGKMGVNVADQDCQTVFSLVNNICKVDPAKCTPGSMTQKSLRGQLSRLFGKIPE